MHNETPDIGLASLIFHQLKSVANIVVPRHVFLRALDVSLPDPTSSEIEYTSFPSASKEQRLSELAQAHIDEPVDHSPASMHGSDGQVDGIEVTTGSRSPPDCPIQPENTAPRNSDNHSIKNGKPSFLLSDRILTNGST